MDKENVVHISKKEFYLGVMLGNQRSRGSMAHDVCSCCCYFFPDRKGRLLVKNAPLADEELDEVAGLTVNEM